MDRCLAFTAKYDKISNKLITAAVTVANGKAFATDQAQWDTGATGTCVSHRVINELKIMPDGYMIVNTPSGQSKMAIYYVDVILPNNVVMKNVRVMESEIGNQGIDILIGMDIIMCGDFSVSNHEGRTQFSFRIPSKKHTDYVMEWNAEHKESV